MAAVYGDRGKLQDIAISWTSDGSGDHTETVFMEGAIVRVVTNPGATAPTDDYDITLIDADGLDLAQSSLLNRDTANSEQWIPTTPVFHVPSFTFTVANAGDTKDGACTIYVAWV